MLHSANEFHHCVRCIPLLRATWYCLFGGIIPTIWCLSIRCVYLLHVMFLRDAGDNCDHGQATLSLETCSLVLWWMLSSNANMHWCEVIRIFCEWIWGDWDWHALEFDCLNVIYTRASNDVDGMHCNWPHAVIYFHSNASLRDGSVGVMHMHAFITRVEGSNTFKHIQTCVLCSQDQPQRWLNTAHSVMVPRLHPFVLTQEQVGLLRSRSGVHGVHETGRVAPARYTGRVYRVRLSAPSNKRVQRSERLACVLIAWLVRQLLWFTGVLRAAWRQLDNGIKPWDEQHSSYV